MYILRRLDKMTVSVLTGSISVQALDDAPHNIRTCYIAPAYPPSTVEVRNLKPITLSELRLETHHAGRVLLVRTFTKSQRLVSVQAGIEDELGDVDTLALYNADPKTKPNQVLPKDTVYAIKEPFYKASAGGGYLVRIGKSSNQSTHSSCSVTKLVKITHPTSSSYPIPTRWYH